MLEKPDYAVERARGDCVRFIIDALQNNGGEIKLRAFLSLPYKPGAFKVAAFVPASGEEIADESNVGIMAIEKRLVPLQKLSTDDILALAVHIHYIINGG